MADLRKEALTVLGDAERRRRPIDEALERVRSRTDDPAALTRLVYGVTRHRGTMDALLSHFLDRPLKQANKRLLWLLRVAVYELLFQDSVPVYATVNESVEIAKRSIGKWAPGVTNGVLRNVERLIDTENSEMTDRRAWLPLPEGGGIVFKEAIWPDPEENPAGFLAAAYSYPEWLVARWVRQAGFETAEQIAAAGNCALPLTLRTNRLNTTADVIRLSLKEAGIESELGELEGQILIFRSGAVERLPGFTEGLWSVQDETQMRVAPALSPEPGETIFDMCAAPGTKTTHLAELAMDRARVIAIDKTPEKVMLIAQGAKRLGLTSVEAGGMDARELTLNPWQGNPFDAVLIDAPCSNTGVLSRRPDARWRLTPEELSSVGQLQRELLDRGTSLVRPGGRIVYSTCSIEWEENEGQVEAFLDRHPKWSREAEETHLPTDRHGGGYWCRLRHS